MFYNLLHTLFGYKPETQLFCRRMYVVWVNSHLQGSCSHLLSSFGKRAGIQIPSRSYLLGDNSTNDSSVDKAGPFISLLPDLIQGPARDDALVSLDTAPCPQGLPALQTLCRTLQTLQCLQTGRALSNCQAHQFELNVGHPSMMHSAKNVKAVPPASLQPSSIPPGLHFPGAESPPSLCSCKKLTPLCCCCCCCLHDLTSCSTKGDTANVQMKLLVSSRYMALPDCSHHKTLFFSCLSFCQTWREGRRKFFMPGVSPQLNLLFNYFLDFQQSGLAISKNETGGRGRREKCCQGNSNPIIF